MEEVHGTDWMTDFTLQESLPMSEAADESAPPRLREPRPEPAANAGTATSSMPAVRASESSTTWRRLESSPGSGAHTGAAESPGSGVRTPLSSWNSSRPGTPKTLKVRILSAYRPEKESIDSYIERIERQAQAAEVLGEPLELGLLDSLMPQNSRWTMR